ncbi:MAG: GAF domain-containing protein [Opitutales bacterium]
MKAQEKDRHVVDALYRISSLSAETPGSAEAFEAILEEVMTVLPANSASLALLNPDTSELEIEVGRGLDEHSLGFSLPIGQGITGWVALHGESLLVPDVSKDSRYHPIKDSIRSEMAAPLEERGRIVGVLNVDADQVEAFDEEDLKILTLLAREASRVLNKLWLVEQLTYKASQLEALLGIGSRMAGKRFIDDILLTITREARAMMDCPFAALFLYEPDKGIIKLHCLLGPEGPVQGEETLGLEQSAVGAAVRGNRQIEVSDLLRTEEHHFTHFIRSENLKTMLVTPLTFEKEVIGTLNVYMASQHRFNDDAKRILGALADLGAVAIQNSRLFARVFDTEQSLRKNERLTTLGLLTAEIAHEIRNPLTVIRLLFDSLDLNFSPEDAREKDSTVIREKLDHLESIVERVLDFGKTREPVLVPLRLGTLIEETHRLVRLKLEQGQVTLIQENIPCELTVRGDKGQLQQALLNLILNAVEAMPQGGEIHVSSEEKDDHRLRLILRDAGIGIPEELQDRIFDSFLTGRRGGTGLGLAIAKKILQDHGGDVELIESGPQGTAFRLTLPIAEAEQG